MNTCNGTASLDLRSLKQEKPFLDVFLSFSNDPFLDYPNKRRLTTAQVLQGCLEFQITNIQKYEFNLSNEHVYLSGNGHPSSIPYKQGYCLDLCFQTELEQCIQKRLPHCFASEPPYALRWYMIFEYKKRKNWSKYFTWLSKVLVQIDITHCQIITSHNGMTSESNYLFLCRRCLWTISSLQQKLIGGDLWNVAKNECEKSEMAQLSVHSVPLECQQSYHSADAYCYLDAFNKSDSLQQKCEKKCHLPRTFFLSQIR